MAQFRLTLINKNGSTILTDYDAVNGRTNGLTFAENVNFNVDGSTLSFSMLKYLYEGSNKVVNTAAMSIIYGSIIRCEVNQQCFDFAVTSISYQFLAENLQLDINCVDLFQFEVSKLGIGYKIAIDLTDPSYVGAQPIDTWARKICIDNNLRWQYVPINYWNTDLINYQYSFDVNSARRNISPDGATTWNNDYVAQNKATSLNTVVSFETSEGNAYAALKKLAADNELFITVDYNTLSFGFVPQKNPIYNGYAFNPHNNLQQFSVQGSAENLITVLNVTGGSDINGQEITLVPALPNSIQEYILSAQWDASTYYNGLYSQIDPSLDASFLEQMAYTPWMENKLIDITYFHDSGILGAEEFDTVTDILENELRKINGRLVVYSQQYLTQAEQNYQEITQATIDADVIYAELQGDLDYLLTETINTPVDTIYTGSKNWFNYPLLAPIPVWYYINPTTTRIGIAPPPTYGVLYVSLDGTQFYTYLTACIGLTSFDDYVDTNSDWLTKYDYVQLGAADAGLYIKYDYYTTAQSPTPQTTTHAPVLLTNNKTTLTLTARSVEYDNQYVYPFAPITEQSLAINLPKLAWRVNKKWTGYVCIKILRSTNSWISVRYNIDHGTVTRTTELPLNITETISTNASETTCTYTPVSPDDGITATFEAYILSSDPFVYNVEVYESADPSSMIKRWTMVECQFNTPSSAITPPIFNITLKHQDNADKYYFAYHTNVTDNTFQLSDSNQIVSDITTFTCTRVAQVIGKIQYNIKKGPIYIRNQYRAANDNGVVMSKTCKIDDNNTNVLAGLAHAQAFINTIQFTNVAALHDRLNELCDRFDLAFHTLSLYINKWQQEWLKVYNCDTVTTDAATIYANFRQVFSTNPEDFIDTSMHWNATDLNSPQFNSDDLTVIKTITGGRTPNATQIDQRPKYLHVMQWCASYAATLTQYWNLIYTNANILGIYCPSTWDCLDLFKLPQYHFLRNQIEPLLPFQNWLTYDLNGRIIWNDGGLRNVQFPIYNINAYHTYTLPNTRQIPYGSLCFCKLGNEVQYVMNSSTLTFTNGQSIKFKAINEGSDDTWDFWEIECTPTPTEAFTLGVAYNSTWQSAVSEWKYQAQIFDQYNTDQLPLSITDRPDNTQLYYTLFDPTNPDSEALQQTPFFQLAYKQRCMQYDNATPLAFYQTQIYHPDTYLLPFEYYEPTTKKIVNYLKQTNVWHMPQYLGTQQSNPYMDILYNLAVCETYNTKPYYTALNEHNKIWRNLYHDYPGIFRESLYTDESAADSGELCHAAKAQLEAVSQPEFTYTLTGMDIYMHDSDYNPTNIHLGEQIRIDYDEDVQRIDTLNKALHKPLYVTGIQHTLRNDGDYQFTVTTRKGTDVMMKRFAQMFTFGR